MRPEEDAYGEILHAIHTGSDPEAAEIIERDDGFIQHTGSAKTYFQKYDEWSEQAQEAIEHAHGTVVDIGCGAGRHALYLQNEKGLTVRGIDISPKAIEVTADRGVKKTSVAGIKDVSDLPESPYDTVVMLGNNLGLLGTKPVEHLNKLADATTENATLIGQTREATATENPEHIQYHHYNKVRNRHPGCLRFRIRYKHFKTPFYDYLYLDKSELKELLEQTQWNLTTTYTSEETTAYTVILEK